MDKVIKIYSVQSEDLSVAQNILDFDIPEGEMYDLSRSHILLNAKVACSSTSAAFSTAVFNINGSVKGGTAGDTVFYLPAVSLVKNARMESQAKGRVEELRDVNLLRIDQKIKEESEDAHLAGAFFNVMGMANEEPFGAISPLIEVSAEQGSSVQRYLNKQVKIPLSDILNVGKTQVFDTGRLGRCRLNLEMAMDLFGATNVGFNADHYASAEDENGNVDDVGTNGAINVFTLVKKYDEDYQEHLGYYVGMPVVVTGKNDGGGLLNVSTVITDISFTAATQKIAITTLLPLANLSGAGLTVGNITPFNADTNLTTNLTLSNAELRLRALGSNSRPSSAPSMLEYTTFTTEKDFGGGTTSFKRQYEIEPEAVNVHVCVKSQAGGLYSDCNGLTSFRTSIDNENTTDRNIVPNTPLYYAMLDRAHLNNGRPLESLVEIDYVRVNQDFSIIGEKNNIQESLPENGKMKLVEFEINTSALGGSVKGVNEINIYKEVLRTI